MSTGLSSYRLGIKIKIMLGGKREGKKKIGIQGSVSVS